MSCRSSAAGSASTTLARLTSGLTDVQTLSAFHHLRREGRHVAAPSESEWQAHVDALEAQVNASEFSEARQRSLLRRLSTARDQRPDGPTWHAVRNIADAAQTFTRAHDARLSELADRLGIDEATARQRLESYAGEVDRSRDAAPPSGYAENAERLGTRGVLAERGTVHAFARLEAEASQALATAETPRRIDLIEFPDSLAIHSGGYDPQDGRLELRFRHRGEPSRIYAYRGVPYDVWAQMNNLDGPGPGVVFNQEIRNYEEHRYATVEEEQAAAHARCGDCGQWRSQVHTCPVPAAPTSTATPEPAPAAAVEAPVEVEASGSRLRSYLADDAPEPEPAPEPPVVDAAAETSGEREAVHAAWLSLAPMRRETRVPVLGARTNRDRLHGTQVSDLRRAARTQPVLDRIRYHGFRFGLMSGETDGLPPGQFSVTGDIRVEQTDGVWSVRNESLRCWCPEFRQTRDCPHLEFVVGQMSERIVPPNADTARSEASVRAAQELAERSLSEDWTQDEAALAAARERHASVSVEDSYARTFAAFEADHEAALARKAADEQVVPFVTENATGGMFSRASGRGFGVELEACFPQTWTGDQRRAALTAIGQELYALELTSTPHQQSYGASRVRGYTDVQRRGWSFERDGTVNLEVVSPVMYDEPEAWENLAKVCEVITRHGGIANAKTGSHVHVGAKHMTTQTATELLNSTNQYEDVLYRFSHNPERPKSRPMRWRGPNEEPPAGGYQAISQVRSHGMYHDRGLNLAGVQGGQGDHPEFRYWDGTLDPAIIQTQVKLSGAMVAAAERNSTKTLAPVKRQPVGSHKELARLKRGRSRRALTSEELQAETVSTRELLDTLFTRREDKAQAVALFSLTKWQGA